MLSLKTAFETGNSKKDSNQLIQRGFAVLLKI